MMPVIFIHTNSVQSITAEVAAYALRARSKRPEAFEVRILRLEETPHLERREGQCYVSGDRRLTWRNRDAQSHGLLRMMVPQVMSFHGRALVLDPDIFAVGDVLDLLNRDMKGRAIVCRPRPRPAGSPPRYNSSVMLLDCGQLTHWKWDETIDEIFRGELDPYVWLTLQREPAGSIGLLEEEWNDLDTLTDRTRLLHNTEKVTQPWKTGLPIDFDLNHVGAEFLVPPRLLARVGARARRLFHLDRPPEVYRPHPDLRQTQYFFALLREGLDRGVIQEETVREEIRNGHLRPDAFALLETAPSRG